MNHCSNCGASQESSAAFCEQCGTRLGATQVLPVGAFTARQLAEQAVALIATGNAPAAAAKCREALRLDPDLAEAHAALGRALERMGKDAEALAAYEEALRRDPGRAAERTRAAALRQRLLPTAAPAAAATGPARLPARSAPPPRARISKRAMVAGAAVAVVLFGLGAALVWARASGPDRTARRQYEQQMVLGRELYAQGDYGGARDAFLAAMEASPRSVEAQRRYNDAAMMAGSRPTAMLGETPPEPGTTIKLQDENTSGDPNAPSPLFPPPATPTIERLGGVSGPPPVVSRPAGDQDIMPPPVVPNGGSTPPPTTETTGGTPASSGTSTPTPTIHYGPRGDGEPEADLWPPPEESSGPAPAAATTTEPERRSRIVVEFPDQGGRARAPAAGGGAQTGGSSSSGWEANPGHALRRQADQLRQQGRTREAAQRYREARRAFEADPSGGSMRTQALSSVDKALRLVEQQGP